MARYRSAFVPHDLRQPLRGADHGPLAGLTIAVKDMYDIVGERTGGGNPSWLAMQKPATRHAGVVQKLLDAGGTIIGKTVCDELFFSVMGVNAHYGMPVNPRAPGRIPGGSSSGSASATASGACDLALGSDTGGSVRIPASFCGLYGLRPTWGRIDASGMMLLAPSFDVAGWFAASPGVFHKGGLWLDGKTVPAAIDHVVQLDDCFAEAQADVAAVMHEAVTQLTPHLPRMSHARVAPDGLDQWREIFRVLEFAEIWQLYRRFVEEQKPVFGPGVGDAATAPGGEALPTAEVEDETRGEVIEGTTDENQPSDQQQQQPTSPAPTTPANRDAAVAELDSALAELANAQTSGDFEAYGRALRRVQQAVDAYESTGG